MSALVFVDTNVLVYSRDTRDPVKQRQASAWLEFLWDTRRGRLSRQVLQEYYVTVTRKLKPGLTAKAARADVRSLFLWLAPLDPQDLFEASWSLQDRVSLSFWDALVVAAASGLGCKHLLSEDLPAGQDLGGVRIVNPFVSEPARLES
jgi:predicted nucleic acid-binding protein